MGVSGGSQRKDGMRYKSVRTCDPVKDVLAQSKPFDPVRDALMTNQQVEKDVPKMMKPTLKLNIGTVLNGSKVLHSV